MEQRIEAWKDLKFGLFIHFGLYSLLGEGEWAMFQKPIPVEAYKKLSEQFTIEKFSAEEWVQTAKDAGVGYMVVTARHHDGFCLFDSPSSVGDFTSMHSAAGRDLIGEYTKACRQAGLKTGIYYSPMDWRFPGFFLPRLYRESARDMVEQCHNQVRELLTNYGKIDVLWFDGGEDYWLCHGTNLHLIENVRPDDFRAKGQVKNFWRAGALNQMVRELQPGIVVNNRTGERQYGDYLTPEGRIGEMNTETPWETCDTINGYWGWRPGGMMRSLRECVHLLVRVVTGDGNLLLNVGPGPDGSIEPEQRKRLRELGQWLSVYGESIYKTRGGPFLNGEWGGFTWRGNKLYLHVLDWKNDYVKIPKTQIQMKGYASLTGDRVIVKESGGQYYISVPEQDRCRMDHIVVFEYEDSVDKVFENIDGGTYTQGEVIVPDSCIIV